MKNTDPNETVLTESDPGSRPEPYPPADDDHSGVRPRRMITDAREDPTSERRSLATPTLTDKVIRACIRRFLGPRP